MQKNGEWIKWDGSDVQHLLIKEEMTMGEIKEHFPEEYAKLNRKKNK